MVLNPGLPDFEKKLKTTLSDEKNAAEAGLDFVRRSLGITRLKQATGLKSHEVCRRNLYIGSAFVFRMSSLTKKQEPLAVALGAAGSVWIYNSSKSERIKTIIEPLDFKECKAFLAE